MAGIAAGLGALGEGFVRGIRIGSDLADSEKRRGLQDLQMKREQAAIDKEQQLSELRTQIASEVSNFKPAGPDDIDGFNGHYERLTPLLMRQAALSGLDPTLVQQSIDDRRKSKYAERLYTALGDIQAGNPMGFEKLKPLYQSFKDKGDMIGGAYDQKTDSITLNFVPPGGGDGKPQSMTLPREVFVRQALGYLNTGDAIKFDVKEAYERRKTEQGQAFETGMLEKKITAEAEQRDQDRKSREKISSNDNAAAERRAVISGEFGVTAAKARAGVSGDERTAARYEKNYDDFRKELGTAFGYDPKNPLQPKGALEAFNQQAAAATEIWKASARSGANLSASEVRQVMEGVAQGKEQTISEKDGWRLVQVGNTRAVVPALK